MFNQYHSSTEKRLIEITIQYIKDRTVPGHISSRLISYRSEIEQNIIRLSSNSVHMGKLQDTQRALVLQGGGSLGAYEAGAYQALYESITKADREKGTRDKPFLNIVAGTSIGAINAAIIVSYVVENNTWDGSSERLNEFWEYLSKESSLDQIPGFIAWWDYLHNSVHPGIASGEAARRYYSAKQFSITGVPTVFFPFVPLVDTRFFDFQSFQ